MLRQVTFLFPKFKLNLEIDSAVHPLPAHMLRDEMRDIQLRKEHKIRTKRIQLSTLKDSSDRNVAFLACEMLKEEELRAEALSSMMKGKA